MGLISNFQRHYIRKIVNCQRGFLITISAVLSTIIFTSCTSYLNGVTPEYFVEGIEKKNVLLPFFIESFGVIFYVMFLLVDFVTGLWSAKIKHKQEKRKGSFMKKDKLYRTFWKLLGIFLLTLLLGVLSVIILIMGQGWASSTLLWIQIVILVAACLYEFQSTGRNIEVATGNKPDIFVFVGQMFFEARKRVLNKFKGKKNEKGTD